MHRLATVVTVAVLVPHAATAQPDHWEATEGPPGGLVNALIIDNGTAFVGSDLGGIFRSDNLGDSWTRLDVTGVFEGVNDFVKDGQGRLFAATDFGVRRSTDGGTTWDLFNDGLAASPYIVSIAVNSSDVLFAGSSISGMFRSENNGENWSEIDSGLTSMYVQALAVGINDTVYVGPATDSLNPPTMGTRGATSVMDYPTALSGRCWRKTTERSGPVHTVSSKGRREVGRRWRTRRHWIWTPRRQEPSLPVCKKP